VKVKVFLGLTFYSDNSFAKNIQHYRKRFDEKYPILTPLHLAIVPPFEMETSEIKSLSMELIEELDSFYFENLSHHSLQFTGLGVHEYKKNKLLYLNPIFDEEFLLCQESLISICNSHLEERDKKIKESQKTFLTIGRFQDATNLHLGIEEAQKDFSEFTALPFKSICLFTKTTANWSQANWSQEADLITFEKPVEKFLQNSFSTL